MRYSYDTAILISLLILLIFSIYDKTQLKTPAVKEKIVAIQQITPKLSVKEKKEQFYNLIVPAINTVYEELEQQYQETTTLIENNITTDEIARLKQIYKANSNEELLMALKPHPKSIAITQAAIESAWITSRFYKEANNIFGIWSFNKNEPRIASSKSRGDKTVWLKKYSTVQDSVRDYYKTLARSAAFKEFRELKMTTDNPYELVMKLDKYSELGNRYSHELSEMIKYNKFFLYDE